MQLYGYDMSNIESSR